MMMAPYSVAYLEKRKYNSYYQHYRRTTIFTYSDSRSFAVYLRFTCTQSQDFFFCFLGGHSDSLVSTSTVRLGKNSALKIRNDHKVHKIIIAKSNEWLKPAEIRSITLKAKKQPMKSKPNLPTIIQIILLMSIPLI